MTDIPKLCWICGDIATTGEHLHKKTDVTAMFGDQFSKRVIRTDFDGNDRKFVQGPNSKELKFQNNLCAKCNNARTRPYDLAYEAFADYIRKNFGMLMHDLEINMNLIFGKCDAKSKQQHLFRYFAKAFGCQLHDAGRSVPQALKDVLQGGNYGNIYRVCVCLNAEKMDGLSIFPLEGDQSECGEPVDFYWAQDNGWFSVVHAYNRSIPSMCGSEWYGKSKRIVLGKWLDIP